MRVRLPIVTVGPSNQFSVAARVELVCELAGPPDEAYLRVRLLEAGAGLANGVEITVRASEVVLD